MAARDIQTSGGELASIPTDIGNRMAGAFAVEEHEGLRLAIKGRTIALVAIAVLLAFITPFPLVLYYHALLVVFVLLGLANLWHSRQPTRRSWHAYAFVVADFALLTFTLAYPNPFSAEFPPQLQFRFGNFIYFHVLLCGLAFSYQPRLVLAGGVAGAVLWAIGVTWIISHPETTLWVSPHLPTEEFLNAILDPSYVDLGVRGQELTVFLITAGLLAIIVARSRRIALRQVASERERGNLARYFPPNMVDRLAQMDAPLSQERELNVAVLFADIVGFTHWSENEPPSQVIALLREVHRRLETAVFDNHGTLDKFIGDGVMATFGTPEASPHDAANALRAALAIVGSFETWNVERAVAGEAPVQISVGIHFGPVVTGDVGTERRMEFAVLGDTVNLASRLEALTRTQKCRIVASDAVVSEIQQQEATENKTTLLENMREVSPVAIRGRDENVRIWTA